MSNYTVLVIIRQMTGQLTPQQAAARAKVGRTTIMRALEREELKAIRDNSGRWKIELEALNDWLSMRTVRTVDGQSPQKVSVTENGQELIAAKMEIATLNAQKEGLEARLADACRERDRLVALLEKSLEPRPSFIERLSRAFGN